MHQSSLTPFVFAPYRFHYTADQGGQGGTGNPPATPPAAKVEPPANEPAKLTLTQAELDARIEAAAKSERDKAAAEKKKADDEAARKKAEEEGRYQELATAAEKRAEEAEQAKAASERRAQLAEVSVALRDHLAAKHPEYLTNAPDIMLHVKEKLAPDAKPEDVTKLIEAEAKAFAERTGKKPGGSGHAAPPRSGVSAGANIPPTPKASNGNRIMSPASRF